MIATAYHGTPITSAGNVVLEALKGRDFLVPFFRPDQIEWIDANAGSYVGDNGMFSAWKASQKHGGEANFSSEYWEAYYAWGRRWTPLGGGRCAWLVIPDPIGVGTQLLDAMIREWPSDLRPYGVPVWHSDEPLERALMLLDTWGRICVGAVGEHEIIGSLAFCLRMDDLWDAIMRHFGQIMPVHMFRSLMLLKPEWPWPFSSHDSTAIARNHWRAKKLAAGRIAKIIKGADRWDRLAANRPDEWIRPPRPQFLQLGHAA